MALEEPEFTDLGDMPSCSFRSRKGAFQVASDSTLRFIPDDVEATSSTCCCSATKDAAPFLAVPLRDLMGASVEIRHSDPVQYVYVHHCPAKQSGDKLQRTACRAGPFVCRTVQAAEHIASRIRAVAWLDAAMDASKEGLAIVNPVSGRGSGAEVWAEVEVLMRAAGAPVRTVTTKHAGHAAAVVAQADPYEVAWIAIVGGDGTFHEVLQGIQQNTEPAAAAKLALCHVPGGSGNGIAATLNLWTPATAAHALMKGARRRLDAVTVLQPDAPDERHRRRLAVLSVQYGMLCNLDIDTEHLRTLLGSERFTYGAIREIVKWKKHGARMAWVLDSEIPSTSGGGEGTESATHNSTKWPSTPLLDALDKGPTSGTLPALSSKEDWPSCWALEEDNDIFYLNVNGPTWAALDYHLNPWGIIDDGAWEFTLGRCKTRAQALQMLLSTQSGSHEHSELFHTRRIAAFAIEPTTQATYLTVDGEKVPYTPLYVEVHKGLLTVVAA